MNRKTASEEYWRNVFVNGEIMKINESPALWNLGPVIVGRTAKSPVFSLVGTRWRMWSRAAPADRTSQLTHRILAHCANDLHHVDTT